MVVGERSLSSGYASLHHLHVQRLELGVVDSSRLHVGDAGRGERGADELDEHDEGSRGAWP
jgi:hypothetical protein